MNFILKQLKVYNVMTWSSAKLCSTQPCNQWHIWSAFAELLWLLVRPLPFIDPQKKQKSVAMNLC